MVPALGVVLDDDRGSLPFALVRGESLVACAAWALGAAEVQLVDLGTPWEAVVDADTDLVLHDALCPLTPADVVAHAVATAREHDAVVVATRPVTDTVRTLHDEEVLLLGPLVDRDRLLAVTSPVVLPASVVRALDAWPGTDLAELVGVLRARWPVRFVEAPPTGMRVTSTDDLPLLEALLETGPGTEGLALRP